MTVNLASADPNNPLARINDREWTLADSQETLDAIRRGDADALVVNTSQGTQQVYTLQSSDQPHQVLIDQMQDGAVTLADDGTILFCNRRLAALLCVAQQRIVGQKLHPFVLQDDRARFATLLTEAASAGARDELTLINTLGQQIPVSIALNVLRHGSRLPSDLPSDLPTGAPGDGGSVLCGILTDLTEQKLHIRALAEANERLRQEVAENKTAKDALRQAQKMEAVGQLTGGLAHDFNNLLAGITGNLELLQRRIRQGRLNELDRHIEAAHGAARRAAMVTQRLLAFSRQQAIDPRQADVNTLVAGMVELIRRTVGPSVDIKVVPCADLWTTRIDHGDLESALLNLCINARDAMPDGGRVTIETANRMLDDQLAATIGVAPGAYVALSVTDIGCGMTEEVIQHAFDPFYTTKPAGHGTGLGLSMIYGFARQSGGQITIDSKLGRGTTMWLYLPRQLGAPGVAVADATAAQITTVSDGETILVIEDEPTILMLVAEILRDRGYRVIEASDGTAGLGVLRSEARIDLLITDIGLPSGMNGRQVADAGRTLRPGLKVLFLTGYAEGAVHGSGKAETGSGIQILTKPFAVDALGERVSSMISGS